MQTIEPRHATAAIFWSLCVMCVVFALTELFSSDTDGLQVILLIGNACLTYFMGMIFNAPEPDVYDTVPIERYPKKTLQKFSYHRAAKSPFYRYDPCALVPRERSQNKTPTTD